MYTYKYQMCNAFILLKTVEIKANIMHDLKGQ